MMSLKMVLVSSLVVFSLLLTPFTTYALDVPCSAISDQHATGVLYKDGLYPVTDESQKTEIINIEECSIENGAISFSGNLTIGNEKYRFQTSGRIFNSQKPILKKCNALTILLGSTADIDFISCIIEPHIPHPIDLT